jgi:carboxypeptidase Taq
MGSAVYETLQERLGEVLDVQAAIALLHWDQEVYMPPKGAEARGRQLATLSALAHRLFTSEDVSRLLREAAEESLDADAARTVAEARYDYDHAVKLPEKFVQRFAGEQSKAYEVWVKARADADFARFAPHLETLVDLLRQKADYLGYEGSPYNALLEEYERGMTVEQLRGIFGVLAARQSGLVERIRNAPQPSFPWLDQEWDEAAQWGITLHVLRDMGFDFDAGRQDKSVHPFTTNFDLQDVRITTRVQRRELFSALTGSIHEGGHALYEQGFRPEDRRTWLAQAPSLGIHESQSRMWENMIGRSLPFWRHYAPSLRAAYPGQLDAVTPEDLHRAINLVRPSFIRVEADECTYNLHIILRFEIELALIEGQVRVAEVPELWNHKIRQYLGLDVPNDALGCLQDIHWSHGSMGYFPTYALGNLYAAQLFEKIESDVPALWVQVAAGDFTALRDWLREHVHRAGRRKTAPEIVRDATGRAPGPEAFLRYLENKYSALYGIAPQVSP